MKTWYSDTYRRNSFALIVSSDLNPAQYQDEI